VKKNSAMKSGTNMYRIDDSVDVVDERAISHVARITLPASSQSLLSTFYEFVAASMILTAITLHLFVTRGIFSAGFLSYDRNNFPE
jgi:hypothetical protein